MINSKNYPANRLFCLDLLRGLDMFYLVCLSGILKELFKLLDWKGCSQFCCTHPWEGFTLYDLIMPLFLFMCGAAVPFALRSRMDAEGRPTAEFHRHVWSRFALLWVLGALAQGGLQHWDFQHLWLYSNTLQTIAFGYVVAAYVMLVKSWAFRIAVPVVLAATFGLIVHFGGDYTPDGNATMKLERLIVSAIMPLDGSWWNAIKPGPTAAKYGYTWFLPSLMFPVFTLAGAYSAEILRSKTLAQWRKAIFLGVFGGATLLTGCLLELAGVRCIKHIFAVSFTLQAIGWSVLALGALYVVTDIWQLRRGTGLLLLFGRHALAAYVIANIFRTALAAVVTRVASGIPAHFPTQYQAIVSSLLYATAVVIAVNFWDNHKRLQDRR